MKWYFASNNQSPGYNYMIKAAVKSALKNTSLEPHFIYDGTPDELTTWLERKSVNVIYHRASFYDHLASFLPTGTTSNRKRHLHALRYSLA